MNILCKIFGHKSEPCFDYYDIKRYGDKAISKIPGISFIWKCSRKKCNCYNDGKLINGKTIWKKV